MKPPLVIHTLSTSHNNSIDSSGDKKKVTFAEDPVEVDKEDDEEILPIIIPAVDLHAQKALRRKILLDNLIKM